MGDIAFNKETFDSIKTSAAARTFNNDNNHQWPKGKVYYSISSGFTSTELGYINAAIQEWQNNTSLTFTVRTNQSNYINIVSGGSGSGFYSDYIGMKGGQQIINLESGGFITSSVIHEIGHAIGFYHEQSRTDRDNSIIINWANIQAGKDHNFKTYVQLNQPGSQTGTFDFNSVMMYGSYYFSSNGFPTITKLDNSTFSPGANLSAGDIETANLMYGGPFARITKDILFYNNTQDDVEEFSNVFVSFFQDAACTIPFTLTTSKTVDLNYREVYYENYWQQETVNSNYTLTFASGNNKYMIAQEIFTYERHYAYGNIIYGFDRNHTIRNGFAR